MIDDNQVLWIVIWGGYFIEFAMVLCWCWIDTRTTGTSMQHLEEHFVFPGWELPSRRLQLCELCRVLPEWGSAAPRIRHHDNILNLR
jgi:hypothetical protein